MKKSNTICLQIGFQLFRKRKRKPYNRLLSRLLEVARSAELTDTQLVDCVKMVGEIQYGANRDAFPGITVPIRLTNYKLYYCCIQNETTIVASSKLTSRGLHTSTYSHKYLFNGKIPSNTIKQTSHF